MGFPAKPKNKKIKLSLCPWNENVNQPPTPPKQIVKTTSTKPNLITVPKDVQNRVKTSIHCIGSLTDSESKILSLLSISENEIPKKLERNKPKITNYCVFIKPRTPMRLTTCSCYIRKVSACCCKMRKQQLIFCLPYNFIYKLELDQRQSFIKHQLVIATR